MKPVNNRRQILIDRLRDLYQQFPQVEAIALAGSLTSGAVTDPASDIDLCVYVTGPVPLEAREALVKQAGGASKANLGLDYWGEGDEWFDAGTGVEVDAVYWDTQWMEGMLDNVINRCQAGLGYTTAIWHTVRHSQVLFD